MNRKVFIFILMTAIFGLCSCLSKTIDWAGLYTGTIPAADGPGINVRLKLNKDNTYELTNEYIGKPDNMFTYTGSFKWEYMGSIIKIDIADAPSYYKVAENMLIQLDIERKPIKGRLADSYVLKKRALKN